MRIDPLKFLFGRAARRGFSLMETQITLTIFIVVIGGMAVTYLFGVRLFEFIKPRLDATDQARNLLGMMSYEVKSAARIIVGSGDLTSFSEVGVNQAQIGSAIQIYPDLNTNAFVRYYLNSSDQTIRRVARRTNLLSSATTVATCVTNTVVFRAEDFKGNVLTNNQNNRVIAMTLQFYQKEYRGTVKSSDFLSAPQAVDLE